ncbi:MAG: hypothetical protein U0529_10195 [Thermoanaerobaculia bacterium]
MKALPTARLLPAGDAPSPFGLHLVLGPLAGGAEEGPVPLPLSSDEGTSRVYLGALKGDADSVIELVAVKLLPNVLSESLAESAARPTNRTLLDRFSAERERLRALRAESPWFPRLLQPDDAGGTLPALLYDKPSRSFFVPPCPACGRPLELLTDELFLRERRLPSYLETLHRLVGCSSCASTDRVIAVFSSAPIPGQADVPVGGAEELLKGLARSLVREWDEELVKAFPCRAASEDALRLRREGGGSLGDFAARWSPFSLCPTPFIVTGLSPVRWDEWTDFVGGRAEADLVPSSAPESLETESGRRRVEWLCETLPPTGRFLYGHDGSGVDAVEVLYLKMTAFRQLVDAVLAFYRATGQPHLDLHPGHVLLDSYGAGSSLPALWTFEVRLHGLASTSKSRSFGVDVVVPPPEPMFPYAAPEILEFRLASRRPGDVYLSEIEPADAGLGVRVEGRLSDPNGLFPRPEEPDWIHVTFPDEALGLGIDALVVRRKEGVPASYEELTFVSEPVDLDDAAVKRLRRSFGVRLPGARYKVFPRFGAPSDLYSLGVLLLRALAGGERTEFPLLLQAVQRAATAATRTKEGDALTRLKAALAADAVTASLFDRAHVFWKDEDRVPGRPNAIPPQLWERAVLLALRLVNRIPGFSIATAPADFVPEDPTGRVEQALREADEVVAELRSLLVHRQPLHFEIQEVLAELLDEESEASRPA